MKEEKITVHQGPIITLTYRVCEERRQDLILFLQSAITIYEELGGIKVGLYESSDEPGLFCEYVFYDSVQSYVADQVRVEEDPRMKAVLAQWHTFIDGPLEVRRLMPVTLTA
ncbi:MAG: hypothetical protein U0103_03600 [Candidatus Obscuribacterales bacterium]